MLRKTPRFNLDTIRVVGQVQVRKPRSRADRLPSSALV